MPRNDVFQRTHLNCLLRQEHRYSRDVFWASYFQHYSNEMLWTRHSDWNVFDAKHLCLGVRLAFQRSGRRKKLYGPALDDYSFLFDFGVTASLQVLPSRQFNDDPIFWREHEDIKICGCECLDIEHRADRTGHGVVLNHAVSNH